MSSTSKTHFLSFAAGSVGYHNTLRRICYQAAKFELFDKIVGKTEAFLQADTPSGHNTVAIFNPTVAVMVTGYGNHTW